MKAVGRKAIDQLLAERDRLYKTEMAAIRELINERDRLYITNFKASEVAVAAALAGSEKAVSAAFLASEKAVLKAEQAQKEYNERSNEFRGQLDDQAKMLMPRSEAESRFKGLEDKFSDLRTFRDESSGELRAKGRDLRQSNWAIGLVVAGVVGLVEVALHFIH